MSHSGHNFVIELNKPLVNQSNSFMQKANLLLLASFTLASLTARAEAGWNNLFNGKDLSGWVQRGGKASYAVEGDTIVGTSTLSTPNTFLCTEKTYADFVLEYDFKVDPKLNSGVQIRSECFDAPKAIKWNDKTLDISEGRVHGYQVEIDPDVPRKRLWSGGIYDEARRGWLFPSDGADGKQGKAFSEQGLRIFKPQDWNHIRVEAIGDSIKTWLNGTPCADLKDGLTARGFIALQVHQIGSDKSRDGTQVRWRNIRIKEVARTADASMNTLTAEEKAAGWRLLWNGKTSEGWRSARGKKFPAKGWTMAEGVLSVHDAGGAESAGRGDIITLERFSSFELVADFKITPGANSGIKYFVQPNLKSINAKGALGGNGSAIGCEFQVLDDERHPDAKLGRDGNRTIGSLYDLIPAAKDKKVNAIGEWNTAHLIVKGNHVEHWLNGQKVVSYDRDSPEFRQYVAQSKFKVYPGFGEWPEGHILLQDHGNQVFYRNIKVRNIKAN